MALLLAVFQKMRIARELNEAQRDDIRITSKLKRAQDNLKNRQKYYSSLFSQIDSQANMRQNAANLIFRNACGMGMGYDINPYSYAQMGSPILRNFAQQYCCTQGYLPAACFDKDGNILSKYYSDGKYNEDACNKAAVKLKPEEFNKLYNQYLQYGNLYKKPTDASSGYIDGVDQYMAGHFMQGMDQAKNMQYMQQQQFQNMSTCFAQDIETWKENQKAMLECQQDEEIDALTYEETMLQMDKDTLEMKIKTLQEEKNSYDQLASEEAKNSAPKFGLG